jgi:nucleotide-binding universal stress UspA family protein
MLRSILIGLDGSSFSTSAVGLAVRWARTSDTELVGLGVVDQPGICRPESLPIGAGAFKQERDAMLLSDARLRVGRFLDEFARRCQAESVRHRVLEDVGIPHEQIVREAQRFDLVMMGRRTYFHFETQEGPDKTLHEVLQASPRPVVTVPENLVEGKCVLVAYDASLPAARTLQAFQSLGLENSRPLHVLAIHTDPAESSRRAAVAVEFLQSHGYTPNSISVPGDSPARVILEHVESLDPGLVVMGTHGKPTLREFFFGSTTRTMLKAASVPLFLYH